VPRCLVWYCSLQARFVHSAPAGDGARADFRDDQQFVGKGDAFGLAFDVEVVHELVEKFWDGVDLTAAVPVVPVGIAVDRDNVGQVQAQVVKGMIGGKGDRAGGVEFAQTTELRRGFTRRLQRLV
jgi:hypothetical protein